MLNRATPPERPKAPERGFFYLLVTDENSKSKTYFVHSSNLTGAARALSLRDLESSELSRII